MNGKHTLDCGQENQNKESPRKVAKIKPVPGITICSPKATFFGIYLKQLVMIGHAISMFMNKRYNDRELRLQFEYQWFLRWLLSIAHRMDDILMELNVALPFYTKVYHAIKRDFAHFFVYEIVYRLQLMKKNSCPTHGLFGNIDSSPGTDLDAAMRKLLTDFDEVYYLLSVGNSEFTIDLDSDED